VCGRSPAWMKGYWQQPQARAATLRDGWLHAGDIGMIDEDGYIHYLGRRKEVLKVKGMSVFPPELEAILARHPAVQSCAVVGVADAQRGQRPVAFVILRPDGRGTAADEIAAWCREVMAGYKVPDVRVV